MNIQIVKNKLTIVVALLLTASTSFAQDFEYAKEKELAEKVLVSMQNSDVETFSSYCIDDELMATMLKAFDDSVAMDKSIKDEISQVQASELRNDAVEGFKKGLETVKADNMDLKEATYPELANYQTRFETANVKCMKVKFRIELEKQYMAIVYLFKVNNDDLFIYDFKLNSGGVY